MEEFRGKVRRVVLWSTPNGAEWMLTTDARVWRFVAGEWCFVRRLQGETVAQFARKIQTNADYHDVVFLLPQLNVFGN